MDLFSGCRIDQCGLRLVEIGYCRFGFFVFALAARHADVPLLGDFRETGDLADALVQFERDKIDVEPVEVLIEFLLLQILQTLFAENLLQSVRTDRQAETVVVITQCHRPGQFVVMAKQCRRRGKTVGSRFGGHRVDSLQTLPVARQDVAECGFLSLLNEAQFLRCSHRILTTAQHHHLYQVAR